VIWSKKSPTVYSAEETKDAVGNAWKALELVVGWVKYADAKAAILLAATGVLGGLLFNMAKSMDPSKATSLAIGAVVLAATAIVVGGVLSIVALKPRNANQSGENPLFYLHVSNRAALDGVDATASRLTSKLIEQSSILEAISLQIISNSTVARRKFMWGNRALMSFGVALFSLLLLGVSLSAGI
jgi:hypothetical protein